jgi:arylsulfatase A-like enzyme
VGSLPEESGFDEHCLWQVKDRGSRYWDATVQENGVLKSELAGKYGADLFVDFATGFMERHRNRPFFFYYPMALTHDPFVPTPRSKAFVEAQKQKNDKAWFADMVAYMDESAGRVIDAVERLGLSKDTLVLFTGDNGTHPSITTATRNGPYQGAKGSTVMAGTHVPLLGHWEGRTGKGVVNEDLIDFTDFLPTLAEVGGARIPADHPRDGRSFLGRLTGKKGDPREYIFCDYNPRWGRFAPARWAMDKRWKLYGDGRFYDLVKDPRETSPLSEFTPEMEKARGRFREVLSRMRS